MCRRGDLDLCDDEEEGGRNLAGWDELPDADGTSANSNKVTTLKAP